MCLCWTVLYTPIFHVARRFFCCEISSMVQLIRCSWWGLKESAERSWVHTLSWWEPLPSGKHMAAKLLVTLSVTLTTWSGGSLQLGEHRATSSLAGSRAAGLGLSSLLILARGPPLPPPWSPGQELTRPGQQAWPPGSVLMLTLCGSLPCKQWQLEPWWPSSKTPWEWRGFLGQPSDSAAPRGREELGTTEWLNNSSPSPGQGAFFRITAWGWNRGWSRVPSGRVNRHKLPG